MLSCRIVEKQTPSKTKKLWCTSLASTYSINQTKPCFSTGPTADYRILIADDASALVMFSSTTTATLRYSRVYTITTLRQPKTHNHLSLSLSLAQSSILNTTQAQPLRLCSAHQQILTICCKTLCLSEFAKPIERYPQRGLD